MNEPFFSKMNLPLVFAFLFCVGSLIGWCLEVVFRKFFSASNPEHKWINPGFCTGPYLPLYGSGLCVLFALTMLEPQNLMKSAIGNKILLFVFMAVAMTIVEYIAGLIMLKGFHVRLWDYRMLWGNVQGLICPLFSLFWALCSAAYYFLIHPYILNALAWLSNNLAFTFFIGLFYGMFILDLVRSTGMVAKLRKWAVDNDVIVRYETLKQHIRATADRQAERFSFIFAFRSEHPLTEHLEELRENFREKDKRKEK